MAFDEVKIGKVKVVVSLFWEKGFEGSPAATATNWFIHPKEG